MFSVGFLAGSGVTSLIIGVVMRKAMKKVETRSNVRRTTRTKKENILA